MDCYLPPPAVGLFRGKTRVVVPSLVEEFLRTVRQTAPRECWNRINDFSQSSFRLLDLLERLPQRRLRSFALNRDDGDVRCSLDQLKITVARLSGLRIIDCESAKHFIVFRNEWLGPSRSQSVTQGNV